MEINSSLPREVMLGLLVMEFKMENRKNFVFALVFFIALFSMVSFVSSQENVCCERTVTGALCINVPSDQCASGSKQVPTSCESTSYCKLGTCINTKEGLCMENTPEIACDSSQGGVWIDSKPNEIAQCQLGCCLIGNQAAFTTKTRCKALSSIYGLEINYREDISNEVQCIANAKVDTKGACVYERDLQNTCKFITQGECSEIEESEFHADILCTNFELNTNCEKSKKTTCVEGLDEVFFLDTCGNLANIYDASRADDQTYWNGIISKVDSCGVGNSNANSASCGSCNYYLGSTCGLYKRGEDTTPTLGDNICKNLGCEYKSKTYSHGETWCSDIRSANTIVSGRSVETDSLKDNLPGTEYTRLICYNGEVQVESCAPWRAEVCIESETSTGFKTAACRINRWQNCVDQDNILDCENTDKRDCKWIETEWEAEEDDLPGIIIEDTDSETYGTCVPVYSPGFDFWNEGSESGSICALANTQCTRTYVYGITDKEKDIKNEFCGSNSWKTDMKNICSSLGDCGSTTNSVGSKSYVDWDSAFVENEGEEEE